MKHHPRHCWFARLPNCWKLGVCALWLAIAGCVMTTPVHTVQSGETLYSIAWQYGLNWHRLARWNDIQPPYRIYPGQRLILAPPARVYGPVSQPPGGAPTAGAATSPSATGDAASATADRSRSHPRDPAAEAGTWIWPVAKAYMDDHGAVSESRKGINISGEFGAPVVAARDGRVVYSGSGLEGYGNLLIIKHGESYLSAYGFNSRLLVSEGAQVSAGERIAEMGMGPGQSAMLHFEIRHDGQPLDASAILPPPP